MQEVEEPKCPKTNDSQAQQNESSNQTERISTDEEQYFIETLRENYEANRWRKNVVCQIGAIWQFNLLKTFSSA